MKSLIPWRQRDGGFLRPFRQEMEDLFERFLGEPYEEGGVTMRTWGPRVDVEESDKEILVKADLPGVDPKNIKISLTGGALILKGEKKEEHDEKRKNYHRLERFVGRFYRELPLPSSADPEKISASSANGVITVTIVKKPEAQAKKIPVKAQD